ncbi:MAG TPA: transcriptional regulator, partial [Methanobacterium subterraneum]|nr:transcriptional regulator [Methanobacterium subterraneum]
MAKVIKKKGSIEPFNPNKIKGSLQKATIDAGYSLEEKKDIINQVFTNINK